MGIESSSFIGIALPSSPKCLYRALIYL